MMRSSLYERARVTALTVCAGLLLSGAAGASAVIPFSGVIDLKARQVEGVVGSRESGRFLSVNAVNSGRGAYILKLQAVHAPLWGDLDGALDGELRFTGEDRRSREVYGEFKSRDILLDRKPVPDARLKFAVREGLLVIDPFWTGGVAVRGSVELKGRRQIDMGVEVVSADIETVVAFVRKIFPLTGKTWSDMSGVLSGELRLGGSWLHPGIKGRIRAYNGKLNAFGYESIVLDVDGGYPRLEVTQATVTGAEGETFRLVGSLDLSDTGSLMDQVRRFHGLPVVETSAARRSWTVKNLGTTGDTKTEMKYLYLKNDRGDAEAVLGVQKSIGF